MKNKIKIVAEIFQAPTEEELIERAEYLTYQELVDEINSNYTIANKSVFFRRLKELFPKGDYKSNSFPRSKTLSLEWRSFGKGKDYYYPYEIKYFSIAVFGQRNVLIGPRDMLIFEKIN